MRRTIRRPAEPASEQITEPIDLTDHPPVPEDPEVPEAPEAPEADTPPPAAPSSASPAERNGAGGPPRRFRFRVRRSRIIFSAVFAVIIFLLLGWLLSWQSPVPIRAVTVVGSQPAAEEEILAVAAVPIGTQLRDLDRQGIADRVDALPGIEGTSVTLDRPWTVEIDVVQRFPFAVFKDGDHWTVLDSSAQVIRDVPTRPAAMPELTTPVDRSAGAFAALSAFTPAQRMFVKSVGVADSDAIQITLRGGQLIQWGQAGDDAAKAAVLTSLIRYQAKGYDVSVPERPAMTGALKLPPQNRIPTAQPSP